MLLYMIAIVHNCELAVTIESALAIVSLVKQYRWTLGSSPWLSSHMHSFRRAQQQLGLCIYGSNMIMRSWENLELQSFLPSSNLLITCADRKRPYIYFHSAFSPIDNSYATPDAIASSCTPYMDRLSWQYTKKRHQFYIAGRIEKCLGKFWSASIMMIIMLRIILNTDWWLWTWSDYPFYQYEL